MAARTWPEEVERVARFIREAWVEARVERVVRKGRRYAVVEKFDRVVAGIARQLDPRAEAV